MITKHHITINLLIFPCSANGIVNMDFYRSLSADLALGRFCVWKDQHGFKGFIIKATFSILLARC